MKTLKNIVILSLFCSLSSITLAKGNNFYTVPFTNAEIKAQSKIYADYAFASHNQTLVCKAAPNDGIISSIEWVYKDATRKVPLPVILKDDAQFEGYFADPDGRLVITNEFGPDSLFVSCEYRKMI